MGFKSWFFGKPISKLIIEDDFFGTIKGELVKKGQVDWSVIRQVGDKKMWVHFGGSDNSINESHRSMIIEALQQEQNILEQVKVQLTRFCGERDLDKTKLDENFTYNMIYCDRGYFVVSLIWKETLYFLSFLFKDNEFTKLEVINPKNMQEISF
ncbi:MAG: hypothetical protein AAFQ94_18560 [Bacteroidota bacterium]